MRLESIDGLAILSFDRPPRNLFDRQAFDDFRAAIEAIAGDPPRGLLIRAEGPVVSGGVDVHVFDGLEPEEAAALGVEMLATIGLLESLPAPTVFAAHALTLTAAFEIALACDLIVATPQAQFGLVEKVVGLTPLMGGTQRLAERVG
jgi:enoyl-CoA hydratase/carnithine racemase